MNEKQIAQIINKISKKIPTPDQKIMAMADTKPVNQKTKKSLFGSVGSLLKNAAPVAASFIPGVGPMASQLLSTLNDDEWFEKYSSAGASFNELLTTKVHYYQDIDGGTSFNVKPRAAMARIATQVDLNSSDMRDIYGASLLASIRSVTNNVLIDDVNKYYEAFDAAANLLAIYYTMVKYDKFAKNQPINIPMINELVPAISPTELNTFKGILESLKNYIQSTIRLPYALTEAIRWRFGTMFHSFNTGQPGLVTYDRINLLHDYDATQLQYVITQLQLTITESGRAGADIYVAFKNHIQRLDVEDAHYDEKEFNLRHNLTHDEAPLDQFTLFELIKDSRLASSPAIQASTLSSTVYHQGQKRTLALFPVGEVDDDVVFDSSIHTFIEHIKTDTVSWDPTDPVWTFMGSLVQKGWTQVRLYHGTEAGLFFLEDLSEPGKIKLASNATRTDLKTETDAQLVIALATSLGFYRNALSYNIDYTPLNYDTTHFKMEADLISYDLARVAPETLRSIQTAALRNLLRADYAGPKPELTNKDIKPVLADVVEIID